MSSTEKDRKFGGNPQNPDGILKKSLDSEIERKITSLDDFQGSLCNYCSISVDLSHTVLYNSIPQAALRLPSTSPSPIFSS